MGGTTPVTANNGVAVFTNIVMNNTDNGYTLTASTPNTGGSYGPLTSAASSGIDVFGRNWS